MSVAAQRGRRGVEADRIAHGRPALALADREQLVDALARLLITDLEQYPDRECDGAELTA